MRCNRSTIGSSSSSAAVVAALGSLTLSAAALADGVVVSYDAAVAEACQVRLHGEPAIVCKAAANPMIVAGNVDAPLERGDLVEFRLPAARGANPKMRSAAGRVEVSWGSASAAGAGGPAAATPVAAAAAGGAQPQNAPPAPGGGPQINVPGAATPAAAAPNAAAAAAPAGPPQAAESVRLFGQPLPAHKADEFVFDFSIPQSPGFVVLGMVPETVVHPRTLRDLVFSLKNGVDDTGKFKTGIALDFMPLQLFEAEPSLQDYLGKVQPEYHFNSLNQALLNTAVSIATTKGTSDEDQSLRLGLGVHVPLIDKSDGRNDPVLRACYGGAFDKAQADMRAAQVNPETLDPAVLAAATEMANRCFQYRPSARWNASVWTVSAGYSMASDSGRFDDGSSAARGIWSSYAYGFEGAPKILYDNAQLIVHAKALYDERVPDAVNTGQFIERDNSSLGLAFRMGTERLNVSLQGSYSWVDDHSDDGDDELQKFALGVEYRIAQDIWLVASIGETSGDAAGSKDSFVLGELKFGSPTQPTPGSTKDK